MPMGVTHRRINTTLSVPIAAGTVIIGWQPWETLALFAGFTFATYFMNPDLDLNSLGYKSWGWLRFIWYPYQKMLGHRGVLSHFPVLSTVLRVIYLLWFPLLLLWLLGTSVRDAVQMNITTNWEFYLKLLIPVVIGMIISDTIHTICDLCSTEVKMLFKKKRRRNSPSFREHHGFKDRRRTNSRRKRRA